jgi:hypothetical protein
MKLIQIIFNLFLFSLITVVWSQDYQINRSVISSGGVINSAGGTLEISASVGEPIIGLMSDSQYQLSSGFWIFVFIVDGIGEKTLSLVPRIYELSQNYPNPFNPVTKIKYALPYISQVKIDIFDVLGVRVHTLSDVKQEPGYYVIEWDGKNFNGNPVSSGVYFYRIIAQSNHGEMFVQTMKMIFLK